MLFLFIFPKGREAQVWGREDLPDFPYFTVGNCESNGSPDQAVGGLVISRRQQGKYQVSLEYLVLESKEELKD